MTPYINDPDFTLHVGDVREVLLTLPDESVHCCVTSPPYWGLRDYGPAYAELAAKRLSQLSLLADGQMTVDDCIAETEAA